MGRKHKKSKVPKLTEKEYAEYISSLKESAPPKERETERAQKLER